ncbi:MAG: ATP-binding protein [Bacteroidales bacterium]|nr:ATP-binding protein [Bacteroidales bacterium]
MEINRKLNKFVINKIKNTGKAIIIYGARQVGKTTFAKQIIKELNLKTLKVNADIDEYIEILSSKNLNKLKLLVSGYEMIFIDEAQRIPDIGINIKILTDEIPELKILITGSSSIDIADKISEPLTGRKQIYNLFPLSIQEIASDKNQFEINQKLEELLIFGSYPEVYTTENFNDKIDILNEITTSYLYKDIFELSNIKYPRKIKELLLLLAFQICNEVAISELSNKLKLNNETVENYIDLLEKSYVIFRLSGFSRNLRKEVSKRDKIFFYDVGIRNAIIGDFNALNRRNDIGELWENFVISERKKYLHYNRLNPRTYFWRTYTGAELDYIEEGGGKLSGFEIKYTKLKKNAPKTWKEEYKNSEFTSINKDNYLNILL